MDQNGTSCDLYLFAHRFGCAVEVVIGGQNFHLKDKAPRFQFRGPSLARTVREANATAWGS